MKGKKWTKWKVKEVWPEKRLRLRPSDGVAFIVLTVREPTATRLQPVSAVFWMYGCFFLPPCRHCYQNRTQRTAASANPLHMTRLCPEHCVHLIRRVSQTTHCASFARGCLLDSGSEQLVKPIPRWRNRSYSTTLTASSAGRLAGRLTGRHTSPHGDRSPTHVGFT